jgi:excisionase family DNA binding protein
MMQEALLTVTVPEAAARRGVSRGRIWQMVQNRQIPAIRKGPLWLISVADLDALPPPHSKGGRPRKATSSRRGGGAEREGQGAATGVQRAGYDTRPAEGPTYQFA